MRGGMTGAGADRPGLAGAPESAVRPGKPGSNSLRIFCKAIARRSSGERLGGGTPQSSNRRLAMGWVERQPTAKVEGMIAILDLNK